jgi:hypothetical protein
MQLVIQFLLMLPSLLLLFGSLLHLSFIRLPQPLTIIHHHNSSGDGDYEEEEEEGDNDEQEVNISSQG